MKHFYGKHKNFRSESLNKILKYFAETFGGETSSRGQDATLNRFYSKKNHFDKPKHQEKCSCSLQQQKTPSKELRNEIKTKAVEIRKKSEFSQMTKKIIQNAND